MLYLVIHLSGPWYYIVGKILYGYFIVKIQNYPKCIISSIIMWVTAHLIISPLYLILWHKIALQIQWSCNAFGLVFIITHVAGNYPWRDHCLFNWSFAGGIQTYGQHSESCCWNAEDFTDWMGCPMLAHWQEYLLVQADKRIINCKLKFQEHHNHSFYCFVLFYFCVQVSLLFTKNAKMLAGRICWFRFLDNHSVWWKLFTLARGFQFSEYH